jgi:putative resolvase
VHPQTAYRWFREGSLPVPAIRVNQRTVLVNPDAAELNGTAGGGVGLDARVSSHDRRDDLDRQVARLSEWAANAGSAVVRVEAEVGSGINGARARWRGCWLILGLSRWWWSIGDRLGPMNTELVEAALSAHGRRLMVLDCGAVTDDLVGDMVEVLTWLCATPAAWRCCGIDSAPPSRRWPRVVRRLWWVGNACGATAPTSTPPR